MFFKMQFLYPEVLYALFALIIPIVVHLFHLRKFKKQELENWVAKKRLRKFYKIATNKQKIDGLNWYENMLQWCEGVSEAYDIETYKVVAIFAALSPQSAVDINKRLTIQFLKTGTANHYKFLVQKCKDILETECEYDASKILNGNKITSFYWNILHPNRRERVTIDRHAIACCLQTPKNCKALPDSYGQITKNQFRGFEKIYKEVAQELGLIPNQLQAIVWESYRAKRELRQYQDVPF